MAGTFSKSARPKRPGAYTNFISAQPEPVLENTLGTVVVPFTHTWGPDNEVVPLNSWADFLSIFGQGGTAPPVFTPGYKAARQAFLGEGVEGRGGAGKVLAYRAAASDAAPASKTLQNATPANAITLTARYKGTFGNGLTVSVVANAANPTTQADLVIFSGGVEVERFTYAKTDINDLAAQINGTAPYVEATASDWVEASAVTSGTALATVGTPTAFTGGADGDTLASADWTAFMAAVEPQRFSVLAPFDLTDASILTSLKTWAQNLNSKGKRFELVVGGGTVGAPDTAAAAVARSASLNDPNILNVGIGVYTDSVLGDLTPSQLAPRVAGILAARGEALSLSFARLAGLEIKVGPTEDEILTAIENGVITIARDSNAQAPVRLEKGITTFTTKTDAARPYPIYSVPKFVRTMHAIETEITEFAESNVIGLVPVSDRTREFVRGEMETRLRRRAEAGIIQAGFRVTIDHDPPPSDNDDFVALLYGVAFARSVEQVFNTVVVG